MKKRFTKEELERRISSFSTFIEKNKWACIPGSKEPNSASPFLVTDGQERAKVSFARMGGIYIVAREGMLKTFLIKWIKQEQPKYKDNTSEGNLKKLDNTFKDVHISLYSPATTSEASPSTNSVRLIADDNPLVDLAERLGYEVYIININLPVERETNLRYSITSDQGVTHTGQNLAETMANLIKQRLK